jgi:LPXTG-motif cell wall-anchored protein
MIDDCMLPVTGSASAGLIAIATIMLLVGIGATLIVRRRPGGVVVLLLVAASVAVVGTTADTADAAADCVPGTTEPATTSTTAATSTTSTTTTTIALRPPTAVDDSFPSGVATGNIFVNDDLGNPTAVITSLAGNAIADPTQSVGVAPPCDDPVWRFGVDLATGDLEVQVVGIGVCVVPYTITNSEGSSDATITFVGDEPPA